jgi:hypothetical protein
VAQFVPLKIDTDGDNWAAWGSKHRHEGKGIPILYVVRANGELAYAKSGAKQGDELPQFLVEHLATAGTIFSDAQLVQIKSAVEDSNKSLAAGDSWAAVKRIESLRKVGQLGKFGSHATAALEADALYAKFAEEGAAALKTAQEQLAGQDKFAGVLGIVSANRIYGKFPELRKNLVSAERDLSKNMEVKEELKQAQALDRAIALLGQNSTKKQAKPALETIVTRFPGTPAAERATAKLAELAGAAAATPATPATPAGDGPVVLGLRTWSDATGKFRIEAELVNVEGGTVNLKKKNGEVVSVPLAKLSKADQEFVKQEAQSSEK